MEGLLRRAEAMGLRVEFRDLGSRYGELHESGLVVVNHTKTATRQRVTLAHEMGHWVYGHDWRGDHDQARDERQANLYAADLLISRDAYRDAERRVGCHPGAIAHELGVTRTLVELRRESLARDARIFEVVGEWRSSDFV